MFPLFTVFAFFHLLCHITLQGSKLKLFSLARSSKWVRSLPPLSNFFLAPTQIVSFIMNNKDQKAQCICNSKQRLGLEGMEIGHPLATSIIKCGNYHVFDAWLEMNFLSTSQRGICVALKEQLLIDICLNKKYLFSNYSLMVVFMYLFFTHTHTHTRTIYTQRYATLRCSMSGGITSNV